MTRCCNLCGEYDIDDTHLCPDPDDNKPKDRCWPTWWTKNPQAEDGIVQIIEYAAYINMHAALTQAEAEIEKHKKLRSADCAYINQLCDERDKAEREIAELNGQMTANNSIHSRDVHRLTKQNEELRAKNTELIEMMPRMADSIPWANKLQRGEQAKEIASLKDQLAWSIKNEQQYKDALIEMRKK